MKIKPLNLDCDGKMFSKAQLKAIVIPLIIEQILAVSMGFADMGMVSSVGEAAVSGVSLVDSINILLIQLFSALAAGGSIVCAQYLGRGDRPQASRAAKQLLYVCLLLSAFLCAVCIAFYKPILHTVFGDIEESVMRYCETYFIISAISYPFLAVYNAGAALFRSMGNSGISMKTSVAMNLINIAGNALLIYVFKMEVLGAAVATLFSRIIGAVIMMILTQNRKNAIYIEKPLHVFFDFSIIKKILMIGIPSGLENSMFQVGKLIVARLVSAMGTAAIAANAICGSISAFSNIPGSAVGLAMITVVGQCMGAGKTEEAEYYSRKLMRLGFLLMMVINVILFVFSPGIISLFNLSEEAKEFAVAIIRHFSIAASIIYPFAFPLPNTLRAAGDVRYTMIVSTASMWAFRVFCCYLFCSVFSLGLHYVWFSMYIDWLFRAIMFIIRFKKGTWKTKHVV